MVVSSHVATKDKKKTPAAQLKRQVTVSPSHKSIEDEVIYLRSQNKLLNNALNAVKNTATDKLRKSYELVWYARNRTRYPSHQVSKWLDNSKEHSRDIDNLHSTDGDFHHGFNSGVLAASRMFKDHAEVSHVDSDSEDVFDSAHQAVVKHQEKIEESREAFPNASADTFPVLRADSN
eukprot:CAMPEP_0201697302 /NCGR_PEP_ID=MMETSP0578-20130828/10536_1 /ASSEMBLY_ACC=CAM_ASM_000663 /TAXON_ID=267565 /ORGANISM="Skeletonema grethea, Strain CCMP 1804" /LENGTH=176 /DNA_ID=CAMNT_0048183437 /DNA_START=33 /DNA_END=563 /DNA_ORIENTATION=+